MEISSDFVDLLRALNDASAEYLIVGSTSTSGSILQLKTHCASIEPWLHSERRCMICVSKNLRARFDFQIGVGPIRIDILTDISGVRFADAWPNRVGGLLGGVPAEFLGRDLIVNKRASGRPKDLADLDRLERDV